MIFNFSHQRQKKKKMKPFYFYFIFKQLFDIRDGICKQTFTGHESDINAITVSCFNYISNIHASFKNCYFQWYFCLVFKTDFTMTVLCFHLFLIIFLFFFSLPSSIFLMALPLQLAQMMQPADCLISVQTKKSECTHMIILYVVSLQLPFLRVVVFYLVAMMISTVMYGMS